MVLLHGPWCSGQITDFKSDSSESFAQNTQYFVHFGLLELFTRSKICFGSLLCWKTKWQPRPSFAQVSFFLHNSFTLMKFPVLDALKYLQVSLLDGVLSVAHLSLFSPNISSICSTALPAAMHTFVLLHFLCFFSATHWSLSVSRNWEKLASAWTLYWIGPKVSHLRLWNHWVLCGLLSTNCNWILAPFANPRCLSGATKIICVFFEPEALDN